MYDLVIRGGTIVDGSGAPAREGDVAIEAGRIAAVGNDVGPGRREVDARGSLVTPGWVDIHTHYDGQVTWDPYLSPTGWNGVTTVVMGNCGVGFAPAKPDRHGWLIELMEGVEDIPGTALAEGIRWDWETFPQYLDALERMPRAIDVGAQVPHGAVRGYVMGERGARNEKATLEEIHAMSEIVREALEAGALGFSSSRTILHRAKDGELVPGTYANDEEILGIGLALGKAGRGVFEVASDLAPDGAAIAPEREELRWMRELSARTGRPVTFACLQNDFQPEQWRRLLAYCEEDAKLGGRVTPQVAPRPAGLLMGLQGTTHPFAMHPSFRPLADLPLAAKVEALRRSELRAKLLSEAPEGLPPIFLYILSSFHKLFPLGDPPDYEPAPEQSIAAMAARVGKRPEDVAYDLLLENDGKELLYFPIIGYSWGNLDAIREMMMHPQAVFGLSDGGAHCGLICDASNPTFLLTHWVRDRRRGERIPLEHVVAGQTRRTAALYGLTDRGLLAPGLKADVNVIDFDGLRIRRPEMVFDLPAGGRRLIQKVEGYRMTILSGEVTWEGGEPTGALPGRLVRGATAP